MKIERFNSPEQLSDNRELKNKYYSLSDNFERVWHRLIDNPSESKTIQFGGLRLQDTYETLYIPFTKEFNVCTEYQGAFKNVDSKYLGVLQLKWPLNSGPQLKIYKKAYSDTLSPKNLQLSMSLSKQKKPVIETFPDSTIGKDGLKKSLSEAKIYLSKYFAKTDHQKKVSRIEEIKIQEFVAQEEEGDLESLLDQLQSL